MNGNNEMEDDDIETVEYLKPRRKGLVALLPEERTPVERAKEAYRRPAERAKEAYRRYAPGVKKAAKKAFTVARKYSQQRKKRHPSRPQARKQPSLGDLLRSRGGKGTGQLTGTLGAQVGMFGKDKGKKRPLRL